VPLSDYERRVLSDIERDFSVAAVHRRRHQARAITLSGLAVLIAALAAAMTLGGLHLLPTIAAIVLAGVLGLAAGALGGRLLRLRSLSMYRVAQLRRRQAD
jgi:small-conductance mechanosensitive channel